MLSRQGPIFLLTYLAVMAVSSVAFNIDVVNPSIYKGEQALFGDKVLQFSSDKEKGVMVSAPYQKNGSGGVCRCVQDQVKCLDIQGSNTTKYKGLSLAGPSSPEYSSPPMFTACTPGLSHECDGNSYLNSICYQFKTRWDNISEFKPNFQECTKKIVNLVFLFDGSGSMTPSEFEQNKRFIKDIMTTLKNTSFEFAAVQFSSNTRTVFNFNDYKAGTALDKLWNEQHMSELTNTHKAIQFVLDNIFENPTAGATPDATKVIVLITDGNPSDTDRKDSIKRSNEKNIFRLIIGVKNVDIKKLQSLASDPKENNTFHIKDYNGLSGILENFQKRIFNIEGSKTNQSENLTKEMSQTGFSAVYYKNTLVLGSVGSNNWRGSLYETVGPKSEEREIQDPTLDRDSYMGYSVAVGNKNKNLLYFTGAPRSEHTGKVLVFTEIKTNWKVKATIAGEQIGSYFGAELCSIDIDSDGNTDFLLVGAPLFHQPQREGKIYVYSLEMNVSVPSRGRFGSSISSLLDLNGDGLKDVAVGAPLEDNHSGAVYIYLGEKIMGIRPKFSQRISASMMKMPSNLQFFGQTIDGNMDLGEDGLTDIVVGARGAIFVLRSRPVITVSAKIYFHPSEISTYNFDCLAKEDIIFNVFTLTVCFNKAEATHSNTGALSAGMNVSYELNVDPVRQRSRAFYSDKDKDIRSLRSTVELRNAQTCFNHSVPFEKNCKKNGTCVADLVVDFSFSNSTLVVEEQSYCLVTIKLSNHGDDSYNTSLTIFHSRGLSFSMMTLATLGYAGFPMQSSSSIQCLCSFAHLNLFIGQLTFVLLFQIQGHLDGSICAESS
uniref:VWFA domain-containing protein n=1 Tax=Esox lucius TaxID=8010 RepID=A0A3P8XV49_ESOLU